MAQAVECWLSGYNSTSKTFLCLRSV